MTSFLRSVGVVSVASMVAAALLTQVLLPADVSVVVGVGVTLSTLALGLGVVTDETEAGQRRGMLSLCCCILLFSVSIPLAQHVSFAPDIAPARHALNISLILLGWPVAMAVAVPMLRTFIAGGTSRDLEQRLLSLVPLVVLAAAVIVLVTVAIGVRFMPDVLGAVIICAVACGIVIGMEEINGRVFLGTRQPLGGPVPPAVLAGLDRVREETGVQFARVLVVDDDELVCAIYTPLWAPDVLLMTRGAVQAFSPAELLAVVSHEAGHLARHHRRRRALHVCLATAVLGAALFAVHASPYRAWIRPMDPRVTMVMPLLASFALWWYVTRVRRRFEFEADAFASQIADPAALASVLRKVDADLKARNPRGRIFVDTETRIARFGRGAV